MRYGDHLATTQTTSDLLEEDDGTLVSFVDGMVTDEPTLRDEMYENAALHDKKTAPGR